VTALLLGLALLLAYAGLRPTLQGVSWYLVGALFIVLVLVAANLTRRLSRRPWLPTLVAAVASLMALTLGYAADKALLGVIPTPDVIARFSRLGEQAWLSIAEQALPATPELAIVFLLALLTAGCALFADLVVRRAPALTAAPLLALLAVPVAIRAGVAEPVWFVLTAIVFLVLLRRGQRRARPAAVLATGVVVIAGSLLLPFVLPPVGDVPDTGGPGIDGAVNPLINLGDDLRQGSDVPALTYSTSSTEGVYLRLATLDRFDGRQWEPADVNPARSHTLARFPAPTGLTPAIKRTTLTATVQVGDISGRWLPVPYPASRITGVGDDWKWVSGGLTVRSQATSASGQHYKARFLDLKPDLAQLRAATPSPVGMPLDVALPTGMPSIIADTAQRVTAGATTEYDKAVALQDYFQSDGGFTYSETAPVDQHYDGSGADIVAEFLQKKAGYCVHFSSAMAIMARTLGIPSRVVVGFQPGTPASINDKRVFQVSSHDLHAWPELYFADIGWLRFEPTPGRGVLPSYSDPEAVDDAINQGDATASPGATASADPSTAATESANASAAPTASAGSSTASGRADSTPWIVVIVLLVAVALLFTPAGIRAAQRARRMRAVARGRDPATHAWAELRDTARDNGWAAPDTETPREFADRLSVTLSSSAARIEELRRSVETTAYARDPGPIRAGELRAVVKAIGASTSGRDRLRAVLLPPSLIARIRGDEE
jgi:transglutaminase-like putative cysteine protease